MAVLFHLKQFDGPLDLLLQLIGKAKIEPKDIFVSEITEQYIEIVRSAPDFDMDGASEFIAMAALLVEIKSRHLLPRPAKPGEEEEDPEEALIRRLELYKQYKESAKNMADFEKVALDIFGKLPEELPPQEPVIELQGLTLQSLWNALVSISERVPKETRAAEFQVRQIRRDLFTVDECIETIEGLMRFGEARFEQLFSEHPTREEAVTLFMALLEVLKHGTAHVRQDKTFGTLTLVPGPAPIFEETEDSDDAT